METSRGRVRLDPRLVPKQLSTLLVLSQGGAPFSASREEPHQLPVALFTQRIQRELPPRVRGGFIKLATTIVVIDQIVHRPHRLVEKRCPTLEDPLVEFRCVGKRQLRQEVAAVKFDGLLQRGGTLDAEHTTGGMVAPTPIQERLKGIDVDPMIRGRSELHGGPGEKQERLIDRI